MFKINYSQQHLTFDNRGIIVDTSFCNQVSNDYPIYPVLFTEYSRINPSCEHFDVNIPIEDCILANDSLSFNKKMGPYPIFFCVRLFNNGYDILIHVSDTITTNLRFGIAHPYYLAAEAFSLTDKIRTPLSFYCYKFHHIFGDQTLLDVPLINLQNVSAMSCFTSLKTNCQFFIYHNQKSHIRITSSTATHKWATFSFRYHSLTESSRSIYLNTYPDADTHLNKWKNVIHDISVDYGIHIIYQQEANWTQMISNLIIGGRNPSSEQIEQYVTMLLNELCKYDSTELKKLNIQIIYLCSQLQASSLISTYTFNVHGYAIKSQHLKEAIYLNVDILDSRIIHHEIFHFAAEKYGQHNTEINADKFADCMSKSNFGAEYLQSFTSLLKKNSLIYDTSIPFHNVQIEFIEPNQQLYMPIIKQFGDYPPKLCSQVHH